MFELEELGIATTMAYYFKEDKVPRQQTKTAVPYNNIGDESKEEAKELLTPDSEEMQNVEGLTDVVEYNDTGAIETLEIEYEKFDMDRLQEILGGTFEGDVENGIRLKMSADMLLNQGFTEK